MAKARSRKKPKATTAPSTAGAPAKARARKAAAAASESQAPPLEQASSPLAPVPANVRRSTRPRKQVTHKGTCGSVAETVKLGLGPVTLEEESEAIAVHVTGSKSNSRSIKKSSLIFEIDSGLRDYARITIRGDTMPESAVSNILNFIFVDSYSIAVVLLLSEWRSTLYVQQLCGSRIL